MNAAPLNLTRPDVPAELAALVTKSMSKDPKDRFQTPIELARALAPFFKNRQATGEKAGVGSSDWPGPSTPLERAQAAARGLRTRGADRVDQIRSLVEADRDRRACRR
jgi:hypothetical protein